MLKLIRNNILYGVIFAFIVYLIISFSIDYSSVKSAIASFSLSQLSIIFFLVLLSLVLKFFRWQLYLNELPINISLSTSIHVFISGLLMGITPGRIGELLKSYLLKKSNSINFAESASVVFAERIIEFIALIILTLSGIIMLGLNSAIIFPISVFLFVLLIFSLNKNLQNMMLKSIVKVKFFKKYIEDINLLGKSFRKLFQPRIFILSILLSVIAWCFEVLGFYYVVRTFESSSEFLVSGINYCLSIIVGALSFLPGGIGTTEGSLTFLIVRSGLSENNAISATILIRIATLWFSVLLGLLAFITFKRGKVD